MTEDQPLTAPSPTDPQAEVVAYLRGRSVPCPRCEYDLRDIQTAQCPECSESLVLKIGSPRARFGWLVVAMAPGCFSGVMAVLVLVPIAVQFLRNFAYGQGLPWPIIGADAFGFLSGVSVWLMYRQRQRFMTWPSTHQGLFAAAVWGVHVLAFVAVVVSAILWG